MVASASVPDPARKPRRETFAGGLDGIGNLVVVDHPCAEAGFRIGDTIGEGLDFLKHPEAPFILRPVLGPVGSLGGTGGRLWPTM